MQAAALHAEANIHLRRQLALAMLQDVQQQLTWQQQRQQYLETLATHLAEQLALCVAQLPPPWHREQLDSFLHQLIRDGVPTDHEGQTLLSGLLEQRAVDEWIDGTPEYIGETLIMHFASAFDGLQQWSADEWLYATFPPTTDHNTDPTAALDLSTWVEQLMTAANVLWPPITADDEHEAEIWLLLPERDTGAALLERWTVESKTHPALITWLSAHPTCHLNNSAIQEIVAIQRKIVA